MRKLCLASAGVLALTFLVLSIALLAARVLEKVVDLQVKQNDDLRNLSLSGHVGFDSLPDQLANKSTSQGFCFNILCVGETGIGKSTLMDTLFNTKFESDPATHNELGVRLKARSYELQESNVRLKLTIVDTVGFGDQINKDDRLRWGKC